MIPLLVLLINCYLVNGINALRLLPLNRKTMGRIGGTDEYGCISSAGYSYCNYTSECQRFDDPCIQKKQNITEIVSEFLNNNSESPYNVESPEL